MMTLFFAVIVSLLAVLGLAIGLFAGRAPIKGSCGGLSCIGLDCASCPSRQEDENS